MFVKFLELGNVAMAIEKLDDDEKLISKLLMSGQNRDSWIINEPGLYSLTVRSNKPEAKKFKRWITHEVLPTIRKTGSYQTPKTEKPFPIRPVRIGRAVRFPMKRIMEFMEK